MQSGNIPEVDFTSLFLSSARSGHRDIALLLLMHVQDIYAEDSQGDNGLTIAAKKVGFVFKNLCRLKYINS